MRNWDSLKTYPEFKRVYDGHRSRADRLLVMYALPNGTDRFRVGLSVSKKVGNSVIRHRITRRLREIVRDNRRRLTGGWDIVVVVRSAAKTAGYQELEGAFLHLAGMHRLLGPEEKTV